MQIYNKNYKKLMIVPLVFTVFFIIAIFVYPKIPQGVDLIGGTIIRISLEKEVSTQGLDSVILKKFNLADLQVNTTQGPLGSKVLIQFSFNKDLQKAEQLLKQAKEQRETNPQNAVSLAEQSFDSSSVFTGASFPLGASAPQAILAAEENFNTAKERFVSQFDQFLVQRLELGPNPRISRDEVGAVLGETFYSSAITVSIMGFVLLFVVIYIFFRELIPAVAIALAALFDATGAIALMAVFGIPVSLATIPAILMLIGYSVDDNILLTTRLLKRQEKTYFEQAQDAMNTGFTMISTALITLFVMLVISYFAQIEVIFQIAAVLLFGLTADLIATWLFNAPLLLWYLEKRKGAVF